MRQMTTIVGLLVLAAWTLPVTAQETKKDDKPKLTELKVATVKQAPKIDGTLDDPAWKSAAVFEKFLLPGGKESKAKTRLYVAQDDKALYITVECLDDEKAIKTLTAEAKDHDGDIWMDDDVELFLDPTADRKSYYQFLINPKGTTGEQFCKSPQEKDLGWNPKYASAAKIGKDSWVVQFALPWSIFDRTPKLGGAWAFNVLHTRQAYSELLYFSPIEGSAHQPDKFGTLTGVMPKAPAASAKAIVPGVDDLPELEVPKGND